MIEVENFISIKENAAELERRGDWNAAIDLLQSAWKDLPVSAEVCLLLIGECYWLLKEKPFYDSSPKFKPPAGWSHIRWDFEDAMLRALEDGLTRFAEDPWFLCAIGFLFSVDEIPFLNSTMPITAYFERDLFAWAQALVPNDPLIARLGWDGNGVPPPLDLDVLRQRLESLHLRETLFDHDILNSLKWSLHIHEQIEVDWKIPLG